MINRDLQLINPPRMSEPGALGPKWDSYFVPPLPKHRDHCRKETAACVSARGGG